MAMIGRLKPGVSAAAAQAETRTIATQMTREHPERNSFEGFVKPLADQVNGRMRLALWVLAGAVGVVMLIVCANLSNLLLARTAARQKEIAIRTALGAGRRRLIAQMLTEGIVLSLSGAVLGLALAFGATRALAHLDAVSVPLLRSVHTDATSLTFTLVIAIVTGIVFGLAPALQSSEAALHDALKDATRGSTGGRRTWVRNVLVVSEIAFACVLLVGAGLLIRSFIRVLDVDLGFRPSRAVTVRVDPDRSYSTREKRLAYFDEVLRRVKEIPGVESAGITDALPLGRNRTWGARAKGVTYERGRGPSAFVRVVSDGYPAAMGIPLVAGRDISPQDTASTEPVMLVNETMAKALWPGQDPIGKEVLNACSNGGRRVVGVVGDVRHLALEQGSGNEMYLPLRQCGDQSSADLVDPLHAAGGPAGRGDPRHLEADRAEHRRQRVPLAAATGRQVDVAAALRRADARRLRGVRADPRVARHLRPDLVLGESAHAGDRHPHGARRVRARRPGRIVLQTLRLAAVGLTIGVVASWAIARSLSGLLFGVTATDPVHVSRDAARPDDRRHAGRLPAGPPRVTDRSAGGAAG